MLEHWNAVLDGREAWRSLPIFYPVKGTLGYSDALLAMGVVHAGLRHAGLDVFAAINAALIVWSALAFAACYAFLRRGFGCAVPTSCLGAFFYAFGWPRFAQLVHLQMQFTAPLPLMALAGLVFLRDGLRLTRWQAARALVALVGLTTLLLATTVYLALFFGLGFAVAFLLCLPSADARHHLGRVLRRHAVPLAVSTVLAALLLTPIAQLYAPMVEANGGRPWPVVASFLATPTGLLWMGRENFVWGWLFGSFPGEADRAWAEGRVGTGLVVTVAWISIVVVAIGRLCTRRPRMGSRAACDRTAALVIVTGAVLQLAMVRLPGGLSLWWLVYRTVPGMSGVRAVGRLQLAAMLPMALGLAIVAERMWKAGADRRWLRPALLVLLCLGVGEQLGGSLVYSGGAAAAVARRAAAAIPATCRAFDVVAAPDVLPLAAPVLTESDFDGPAYLQANPDVARSWAGSAWEHYNQFGRNEHRFLDPAAVRRHFLLNFYYAYTVPLAAELAGKPTVNGLSGWEPPGYDLGDVFAPDAASRLSRWLMLNGLPADAVCTVAIRLDGTELPERLAGLW